MLGWLIIHTLLSNAFLMSFDMQELSVLVILADE